MPALCLCVLLAAAFILPCAQQAAAKDIMKWFRVDIPPVYILNDDSADGFGDQSMQFVMDKLTHYDHRVVNVNMSRGLEMLKRGDRICFSTLLKNSERTKFIEFSTVSQLVLPVHLVIRMGERPKLAPYMDGEGRIDLDLLLQDTSITIGIASDRSYSKVIDDILKKYRMYRNVYIRPSSNIAAGLVDMVGRERIDCTLEFPVTVAHLTKSQRIGYHLLDFIPIKGLPKFFQTHFAAPKNAWGKKVIDEIDAILLQHRASDEYIGFYQHWLTGPTRDKYLTDAREAHTSKPR